MYSSKKVTQMGENIAENNEMSISTLPSVIHHRALVYTAQLYHIIYSYTNYIMHTAVYSRRCVPVPRMMVTSMPPTHPHTTPLMYPLMPTVTAAAHNTETQLLTADVSRWQAVY